MVNLKENVILHIEDEASWRRDICNLVTEDRRVIDAYGNASEYEFLRHDSQVTRVLSHEALQKELDWLNPKNDSQPVFVSVASGQVARSILAQYLPGAIISDSGFPLNGARTVKWLIKHGLGSYPLIGLSATSVRELGEEVEHFFTTNNARYFSKLSFDPDALITQLLFNREWNIK